MGDKCPDCGHVMTETAEEVRCEDEGCASNYTLSCDECGYHN